MNNIKGNAFKLLLDDMRDLSDCYPLHPAYLEQNWVVVRNYDDFVEVITKAGLPEFLSFDHDLADEHYSPEMYNGNAYDALYDGFKEKTGLHAAKWLVDYCIDNTLPIPEYTVHSFNPIGKENIKSYLEQAKQHLKQ